MLNIIEYIIIHYWEAISKSIIPRLKTSALPKSAFTSVFFIYNDPKSSGAIYKISSENNAY